MYFVTTSFPSLSLSWLPSLYSPAILIMIIIIHRAGQSSFSKSFLVHRSWNQNYYNTQRNNYSWNLSSQQFDFLYYSSNVITLTVIISRPICISLHIDITNLKTSSTSAWHHHYHHCHHHHHQGHHQHQHQLKNSHHQQNHHNGHHFSLNKLQLIFASYLNWQIFTGRSSTLRPIIHSIRTGNKNTLNGNIHMSPSAFPNRKAKTF